MADNVVSQKRPNGKSEETAEKEGLMPSQKRATPITFEQQIIDLIKEEKVKDDKEKEEEAAIYNSLSIEIQEDNETQYDKESRCSQSQPQSLPESLPESPPSLQSIPAYNDPVASRADGTLDQDCLNMIDEIYLDCQNNLREFFYSKISALNRVFESRKLAYDKFLQIEINTRVPGKFILEINMSKYEYDSAGRPLRIIKEFECVHFSLFTRIENGALTIRGLHFTLPDDITTRHNKKYSHLYIGHIVAENSLGSADAANKFIITILKSIGTYFETQMSISRPGDRAKESVIKFIRLLKLNSEERQAIGKLLKNIGAKYKEYFKTLAASGAASGPPSVAASGAASGQPRGQPRGGMKIMKYNKVVEKSNSKDGKNTLVNNKELKINKIKDKIKILKQDKIKNKDKIIKQIKLIEDIKTKIKIEKERAKQKHKEKASIIKRKASVSKTTKTTTAKPKTTTAKPKTTTTKPKTTTAKPKTTTAKPKTTKTTTTKPKTTKTTAAKPKTTIAKPKTTTTKPKTPKTTTAKPKTTKRQANK